MSFVAGFLAGSLLIIATTILGQGGFLAGFVVGALSMWFHTWLRGHIDFDAARK